MNYKPIKDFIYVKFLKINFEEKKTSSGIIVKGNGQDLANKVYSAEVIDVGGEVKEVEKGDIVYFINYKPIPLGEGDFVKSNLIVTKEGNILLKRKKKDGDEVIEQNF